MITAVFAVYCYCGVVFADAAVVRKLMVLFMPQTVCLHSNEMRNESRLWRDYGSKAKKQKGMRNFEIFN